MKISRKSKKSEKERKIILKPIRDDDNKPSAEKKPVVSQTPGFVACYLKGQEDFQRYREELYLAAAADEEGYVEISDLDLWLHIPERLSGRSLYSEGETILICQIVKKDGEFYAELLSQDSSATQTPGGIDLFFLFGSKEKKTFPFLEYCAKKRVKCSLIGSMSRSNTFFEISDIVMGSLYHERLFSKNHYQEEGVLQPAKRKALQKLLGKDVELYGRIYESMAECALIFEFFRDYYPDDVAAVISKSLADQEKEYVTASAKRQELATAAGLINVDWRIHDLDSPSISEIREKLDREFYGMESVKKRILEIMARLKRSHTVPSWGILLQGPPGVGKTSMVQFFTELLGSPVIYLDTGSTQDNVGIVGSSKIYDNGQPGVIMREIIGQHTAQQTLVINEIDKMDAKGQNVLLSLLDRKGYTDANIDAPIALTGLTFVATSNDLASISEPIKDRFEIIELPPYTPDEKQHIFSEYVFPALLRKAGLSPDEICIDSKAVETLCKFYANDCGVRDLEKYGERVIDDYLLSTDSGTPAAHSYDMEKIAEIIGSPRCSEVCMLNTPGLVRSITVNDGRALSSIVEARVVPGHGEVKIIGAPGKFTENHITAACQYVRSLGWFSAEKNDILLRIQHPGFDSAENTLGLAALCAINSDVNGTVFDSTFAVIGGITLHGGLYYEGTDIDTTLSYCEENGIEKILCPVGCTDKIKKKHENIALIEAYDVAALLIATDLKV